MRGDGEKGEMGGDGKKDESAPDYRTRNNLGYNITI